MTPPESMLCPACGNVHPPIECLVKGIMGVIKSLAFVAILPQARRSPPVTFRGLPEVRLAGSLLTAEHTAQHRTELGQVPFCAECDRPASVVEVLDYVHCEGCKRALYESDVRWVSAEGSS